MIDNAQVTLPGPLWLNVLLCVLGFLLRAFSGWRDYRKINGKVSFWAYLNEIPDIAMIGVVSSALAFLCVWSEGWLNPLMSVATGYMSTELINQLLNKTGVKGGEQ